MFCFIDTETTGLYPVSGDRICEIALLIVSPDLTIIESHTSLVNPGRNVSPAAQRVHRIEPAELKSAPPFGELADKILFLLKDRILVGHNVNYDYDFIVNEYRLLNMDYHADLVLDTKEIAQVLVPLDSYGLSRLLKHFEINIGSRHRAMGDCQATFALFKRLVEIYRADSGCSMEKFMAEFARNPHAVQNDLPTWLKDALERNIKVEIEYLDRSHIASRRIIQPLRVFQERNRLYLEAFCQAKNAKRTFLIERIKRVDQE